MAWQSPEIPSRCRSSNSQADR